MLDLSFLIGLVEPSYLFTPQWSNGITPFRPSALSMGNLSAVIFNACQLTGYWPIGWAQLTQNISTPVIGNVCLKTDRNPIRNNTPFSQSLIRVRSCGNTKGTRGDINNAKFYFFFYWIDYFQDRSSETKIRWKQGKSRDCKPWATECHAQFGRANTTGHWLQLFGGDRPSIWNDARKIGQTFSWRKLNGPRYYFAVK